jgi:nitronate monooxygenase
MAGAGGPALAIGAMRGGAAGALPCATVSAETVTRQAAEVRAACSGPINLNFFCHADPGPGDEAAWHALLAPYYREYGVGPPDELPSPRRAFDEAACELVEAVRPEIASFHFGLPEAALLDRVRATGAVVIASATTLPEGLWLASRGADAVIAQGWEAGGHSARFLDVDPSSRLTTFALVPLLVDALDVPVVAAGGISDARGVAAAALLGAAGVQIGTAFLACPESLVSPPHRALLGTDAATVMTNLFSGRPARGFATRLTRELGAVRDEVPPFPHGGNALAALRTAAPEVFANMWAGQAAGLARAEPAEQVARRIATEATRLLAA